QVQGSRQSCDRNVGLVFGVCANQLLITGWNGNGKIPTNGAGKVFLDLVVSGNGLLAASSRIAPNRMTAAFSYRHATVFLEMAEQRPAFHATSSSTVSASGSSRRASSRSVSMMSCTA